MEAPECLQSQLLSLYQKFAEDQDSEAALLPAKPDLRSCCHSCCWTGTGALGSLHGASSFLLHACCEKPPSPVEGTGQSLSKLCPCPVLQRRAANGLCRLQQPAQICPRQLEFRPMHVSCCCWRPAGNARCGLKKPSSSSSAEHSCHQSPLYWKPFGLSHDGLACFAGLRPNMEPHRPSLFASEPQCGTGQ